MNKLNRMLSIFLVFSVVLGTSIGFQYSVAFAAGNSNSVLSSEELEQYGGIDLTATQFNVAQMNDEQKELYNLLLEKEYDKQASELASKGISKDTFIAEVSSYLYGEYGGIATRATRLISVNALGSALNVVITAALIATGVGSIGELVKNLGKNGAKAWLKKHVAPKIIAVLAKIGASKLGVWIGAFVIAVVDTYLDPGTFIAKKLDSVDKVPNSGYIELW